MKFKFEIIDLDEDKQEIEVQKDPLPIEFGRNLDTVEKARKWLTNPHTWRDSNTYIIYWDGIVPHISSHHGRRLLEETWDNGLPEVVVREQRRIRSGGKQETEIKAEPEGLL